jgi:hypothetical protein
MRKLLFESCILILGFVLFTLLFAPYNLAYLRHKYTKNSNYRVVNDLNELSQAVEKYKIKYGKYPIMDGYAGYKSCYGPSAANWIPGLVPEFIEKLPIYKTDGDCESQYYYTSDGKDYKIIAHRPDDIKNILSFFPELYDSARPMFAVSVFSPYYRTK